MFRLSNVLRINAASCLTFGAAFAIAPATVATFLGADAAAPTTVLRVLGGVLIINGLHLLWAAMMKAPARWLIVWFSGGDFAWVIGSLAVLASGQWVTTAAGIAVTLAVAAFVAVLGAMQLYACPRTARQ